VRGLVTPSAGQRTLQEGTSRNRSETVTKRTDGAARRRTPLGLRCGMEDCHLADEDLMASVEAQNTESFATLYDRHSRAAYSLAYRMMGERQARRTSCREHSSTCGGRQVATRRRGVACAPGCYRSSTIAAQTSCVRPRGAGGSRIEPRRWPPPLSRARPSPRLGATLSANR
jgi:hypothetical protein